ncbi:hypothetical protein T4A_5621 [Trichinella pseudospiralis]|uniref:Uncharacterized protein n=1 Tax=Trichinella pseudospiralis TaxID=6337 RepID=A0A0V1DK34_TRIPS|nr:hypothetical protein T4A_5621 [Trichinella pseudospiralis]
MHSQSVCKQPDTGRRSYHKHCSIVYFFSMFPVVPALE